ncbi:hypothetical protein [Luteimonas huabeiensis]|uniref:hypothetical protein n=1 Tax=Luteimonas huabeiensis TaxID=1244513 RepID=UPI000467DE8C|nr:hypothetical protein [Luteimonas huabeiensis]
MQFDIHLDTAPLDLEPIALQLQALDPAALVDIDPATGALRVSTYAGEVEIALALARAGHRVAADRIVQLPSVCCGGCGG